MTNPQTLIPEHLINIKPILKADLRFIGWWNLRYLLTYWQEEKYKSTTAQPLHAKRIKLIVKIMADAKDKPPFASFRPRDYFTAGQKVLCLADNGFTKATVIHSQNETVTVKLRCSKKMQQIYEKSPTILHDWEYNYLKKHFKYKELWTKHSGIDATFF